MHYRDLTTNKPIGKALAIKILNNTDGKHTEIKGEILESFYQKSRNVMSPVNEDHFTKVSQNSVRDFTNEMSSGIYGKFNAEQAQSYKEDGAYKNEGSAYYQDFSKGRILNEGLEESQGGSKGTDVSAQKYQVYTTEDGKVANIVDNVKSTYAVNSDGIAGQRQIIEDIKTQSIADYAKEADRSGLEKVVTSTVDSVMKPIEKYRQENLDHTTNQSFTKNESSSSITRLKPSDQPYEVNESQNTGSRIAEERLSGPKTYSEEVRVKLAENDSAKLPGTDRPIVDTPDLKAQLEIKFVKGKDDKEND